jgi:hypothetical protein
VNVVHNGIEYGLMAAYAEGLEFCAAPALIKKRPRSTAEAYIRGIERRIDAGLNPFTGTQRKLLPRWPERRNYLYAQLDRTCSLKSREPAKADAR